MRKDQSQGLLFTVMRESSAMLLANLPFCHGCLKATYSAPCKSSHYTVSKPSKLIGFPQSEPGLDGALVCPWNIGGR